MIKLNPDEKVVLELRRHWYYFVSEAAFIAFLAILPVISGAVLSWSDLFELIDNSTSLFWFLTFSWYIFLWTMFFVIWTEYYLDVWVVTDKRIIDIEQFSLFSRDISEVRLDKVQDVTIEIKGLIPTFLGFGNIYIQTASEHREFAIRSIPDPHRAKDIIMQLVDKSLNKPAG